MGFLGLLLLTSNSSACILHERNMVGGETIADQDWQRILGVGMGVLQFLLALNPLAVYFPVVSHYPHHSPSFYFYSFFFLTYDVDPPLALTSISISISISSANGNPKSQPNSIQFNLKTWLNTYFPGYCTWKHKHA